MLTVQQIPRRRNGLPVVLAIAILGAMILGADQAAAEETDFRFTPDEVTYAEAVPTLASIVGHAFGERMTAYHEMTAYMQALAESSDRVVLREYGKSWEGRTLYYMVIGSPDNLARLPDIQKGMRRLADPRTVDPADVTALIDALPSIAWLAYCVHGNEASGTDAGLLLAYHLAAASGDAVVDRILENSLVIIDPLENPDGRERFVQYNRQARGRWADADPASAEHREPWPSGRVNHYLFDMNRDWFALSQPETIGRIEAYLQWMPNVFADVHEMGGNSSYYFPPPADPINPNMKTSLIEWTATLGRNHARWFDRLGFDYFTREVFDSFYPGYGESWPLFQGAVGMTFEAAGTGGLIRERDDDTVQRYRDAVQKHFIASLSTCEATAANRAELLADFYELRETAIREGEYGDVREFVLVPDRDPAAADRLVALLIQQGIEVDRAAAPFTNRAARSFDSDTRGTRTFPAGSYRVSLAQPSKHLIKTLLAKNTEMKADFVEEQIRRIDEHRNHQIYDITGWSLPLLFNVDCFSCETASDSAGLERMSKAPERAGGVRDGRRAEVAYLVPWTSFQSARFLARLFREEIRVLGSDKPFVLSQTEYPAGSLIIKVHDNDDALHARVDRIGKDLGVTVHTTDTSWVEDGVNFGSGHVQYLRAPRVALLWGSSTSAYSAGASRFLMEHRFEYPVTCIPADGLARARLERYDVIILPGGSYQRTLAGSTEALKRWVSAGGTLLGLGSAVRWLAAEKVGFLPIESEKKLKKEEKNKPTSGDGTFDYAAAIRPETEWPTSIPGAILRVQLDEEHWMAHGLGPEVFAVADTRSIFTPIRIDEGRNVGIFATREKVLASGVGWETTIDQVAQKPYLIHRPQGRGHVIAFVEDPTFRAAIPGLELLFANAVFRGASH